MLRVLVVGSTAPRIRLACASCLCGWCARDRAALRPFDRLRVNLAQGDTMWGSTAACSCGWWSYLIADNVNRFLWLLGSFFIF